MVISCLPSVCVSHVSLGIVVCFPMDHTSMGQSHRQAQAHSPATVQETGHSEESGCLNSSWKCHRVWVPFLFTAMPALSFYCQRRQARVFTKLQRFSAHLEKLPWVHMSKSSGFCSGFQKLMTSESDGPESYTGHVFSAVTWLQSISVVRIGLYKRVDTDWEFTPPFCLFLFSFKNTFSSRHLIGQIKAVWGTGSAPWKAMSCTLPRNRVCSAQHEAGIESRVILGCSEIALFMARWVDNSSCWVHHGTRCIL